MITEDYVSFETAKLLKKKGFDEPTLWFYVGDGTKYTAHKTTGDDWWRRPTIQMTMKWLREVYGLVISIYNGNHKTDNRDTSTPDNVYYFFDITDARAVYDEEKQCYKEFISYEEACEGAIQYCLQNLI